MHLESSGTFVCRPTEMRNFSNRKNNEGSKQRLTSLLSAILYKSINDGVLEEKKKMWEEYLMKYLPK